MHRPSPLALARTLALAIAIASGAFADARASIEHPFDPCRFVRDADVLRLLGWEVTGRSRRHYDLQGGTGSMCFLSSSQGDVIVIAPDPGTQYPGIAPDSDPAAAGFVRHSHESGADVTLYNGTVYVVKHHRNIAVRVVPQTHAASYAEVEPFASLLIAHIP